MSFFLQDENLSITTRKLEIIWNNRSIYKHLWENTFPISVLKSGIIYGKMLNFIAAVTILNAVQMNQFSVAKIFLHTWKYNAASGFYSFKAMKALKP